VTTTLQLQFKEELPAGCRSIAGQFSQEWKAWRTDEEQERDRKGNFVERKTKLETLHLATHVKAMLKNDDDEHDDCFIYFCLF
jgi:hypothetical protein